MRLVISHFFDEEFMLPWWLRHHRELFDHGILIDYASTDRSVEICRELVDGFGGQGRVDFLQRFAVSLPVRAVTNHWKPFV